MRVHCCTFTVTFQSSRAAQVCDPEELQAIEQALALAARRTSAECPNKSKQQSRKRQLPASLTVHAHAVHAELPPLDPAYVQYAASYHDIDYWARKLLNAPGLRVLGLDTEWRVPFQAGVPRPPVALLQLCYRLPTDGACTTVTTCCSCTRTTEHTQHRGCCPGSGQRAPGPSPRHLRVHPHAHPALRRRTALIATPTDATQCMCTGMHTRMWLHGFLPRVLPRRGWGWSRMRSG